MLLQNLKKIWKKNMWLIALTSPPLLVKLGYSLKFCHKFRYMYLYWKSNLFTAEPTHHPHIMSTPHPHATLPHQASQFLGSILKSIMHRSLRDVEVTVETLYSTIYYSKYFIELNIDKSTLYVALCNCLPLTKDTRVTLNAKITLAA